MSRFTFGSRFRRFNYREWEPIRWWELIVPIFITDEYGRRTMVVHIPIMGFLSFAYWTCNCADCIDERLRTRLIEQGRPIGSLEGARH